MFCGMSCSGRFASKEHFWGKWLQKHYSVQASPKGKRKHLENRLDENGKLFVSKNGFFAQSGHPMNSTIVKTVCKKCNSEWMKDIQTEMSNLFAALKSEKAVFLSVVDCRTITNWFSLKQLMFQFRANTVFGADREVGSVLIKNGFNLPDNAVLETAAREKYSVENLCFYKNREVPKDWELFLMRSPYSERGSGSVNFFPFAGFYPPQPKSQTFQYKLFFCTFFCVGDISAVVTNFRSADPKFVSELLYESSPAVRVFPMDKSGVVELSSNKLLQASVEELIFKGLPRSGGIEKRRNFGWQLA
jgi:hypothetical protein